MTVLGIDHGEKRVGLAISAEGDRIALPRETLIRDDPAALVREIAARVAAESVTTILVGLPLTLEGREGASARRARRFAEHLGEATGVPVVLWDERLSTTAALGALSRTGVRGADRKSVVDQVAATLLLQSYLDSKRERDEPWPVNEDTLLEPAPEGRDPRRSGRARRRSGRSRGR